MVQQRRAKPTQTSEGPSPQDEAVALILEQDRKRKRRAKRRARRKQRVRHGRDFQRVGLDDVGTLDVRVAPEELLDLDVALTKLESIDPKRAQIVNLRFFAGLTVPEAAQAMGVSRATAERYWTFARTWLFAELSEGRDRKSEAD